jgi:hypothetical protein
LKGIQGLTVLLISDKTFLLVRRLWERYGIGDTVALVEYVTPLLQILTFVSLLYFLVTVLIAVNSGRYQALSECRNRLIRSYLLHMASLCCLRVSRILYVDTTWFAAKRAFTPQHLRVHFVSSILSTSMLTTGPALFHFTTR